MRGKKVVEGELPVAATAIADEATVDAGNFLVFTKEVTIETSIIWHYRGNSTKTSKKTE